MKNKLLLHILILQSLTLFSISSYADDKSLTDDQYKFLYAPEGLPACLWVVENRKQKRQLGISPEMWKRMWNVCTQAENESKNIAKKQGYDPLIIERDTNLRDVKETSIIYKKTIPDWESKKNILSEKIKRECGTLCDNGKTMLDEDIRSAKEETNEKILESLGL